MNWEVVAAVGELLGAIGVIASLVYLAGQVRISRNQAAEAASQSRQTAVQSVVNKMNDFYNQLIVPGSADLWVRGSRGMSNLSSEEEKVQFSSFLLCMFRPFEEIYHYRGEGLVDDWLWESISGPCVAVMGTEGFADWWALRGEWFSSEFRAYVTDALGDGHEYVRHA